MDDECTSTSRPMGSNDGMPACVQPAAALAYLVVDYLSDVLLGGCERREAAHAAEPLLGIPAVHQEEQVGGAPALEHVLPLVLALHAVRPDVQGRLATLYHLSRQLILWRF